MAVPGFVRSSFLHDLYIPGNLNLNLFGIHPLCPRRKSLLAAELRSLWRCVNTGPDSKILNKSAIQYILYTPAIVLCEFINNKYKQQEMIYLYFFIKQYKFLMVKCDSKFILFNKII